MLEHILKIVDRIVEVRVREKVTGRCGVVGSILAFGSIGHVFECEHRLFSHHRASAFS